MALFLCLSLYLIFLVFYFSCVLHISSLYFDFVISPPIILIAGRWNSSGIHLVLMCVYTSLFFFCFFRMSWNWVRRLEKEVSMHIHTRMLKLVCKKCFKKKCSQHIFSRIHRYIKFTFGYILNMMLRRDLPLMLDYTWSIFSLLHSQAKTYSFVFVFRTKV